VDGGVEGEIGPRMLQSPKAAGIRHHTVFRHDLILFGSFEIDGQDESTLERADGPVGEAGVTGGSPRVQLARSSGVAS
jgi:hypothetical protein